MSSPSSRFSQNTASNTVLTAVIQCVGFLSEQVTFKCLTKGLFLPDDKAEKVNFVIVLPNTQFCSAVR